MIGKEEKKTSNKEKLLFVSSNSFFSYFYILYIQLQGIDRFVVYICYITNDVNVILVKKRKRHVLMHALGVFARIQAQSSISDSNSYNSNDSNARG